MAMPENEAMTIVRDLANLTLTDATRIRFTDGKGIQQHSDGS